MGTTVSAFKSPHGKPTDEEKSHDDKFAEDFKESNSSLVHVMHVADSEEDMEPAALALQNRKRVEKNYLSEVQRSLSQISTNSEILKEHAKEVAMGELGATFLPKRKSGSNPFRYDEFDDLRKSYHRDLIAKQTQKISRSQNQAKAEKLAASDSFLRIHKAISDAEGWGPGLLLSYREKEWTIVGISKNSGASVSGVRLNDKIISVNGHSVSSMSFDNIQSLLLGPKDSNVVVVVSNRKFIWSTSQAFILIRSLPSASFNFSSQEVVRRTLHAVQVVENIEMSTQLEEQAEEEKVKSAKEAAEAARAAEESAVHSLLCDFVAAPLLNPASVSLIETAITQHVKSMGIPSFIISIHDRSLTKGFDFFSAQLADKLSRFIRLFFVEPVINIIDSYHIKDTMSDCTWRSSIEQGASTNGIPVCILIWQLEHWDIWQQWMKKHHTIMLETNRSIDSYKRKLLSFDDKDFVQEAVHIFSAKDASQVSRIFVLLEDDLKPSVLVDSVDISLMQFFFDINFHQVVFIFQNNVKSELSILQRVPYSSVESIFENKDTSYTQYYLNLLNLCLKNVSSLISSIHGFGPDIRRILCSGKSVITSKFIPEKRIQFSSEEMVKSLDSVVEQRLLKHPHHFVFHRIIHDWPNEPLSALPGKKLFFFTPPISGFSSVLDWIHGSLRSSPVGFQDVIPILIRVPKCFHGSGLAESQSVIFAMYSSVEETLSAPPFNFFGTRNVDLNFSSDSPENLVENLAKILSVACKQLCVRILIMIDNIHYINFDTESIGCMQWTFSRMPQNVRVVFPFLLNTPIQMSLKTYVESIKETTPAGMLDYELLEDLEYRKIPVLSSHQRFFFNCFIKSGTACKVVAEKMCEDYFALYLRVNPNMDSHIWLLIVAGYFMVHHLWNVGVKPIEIFLSSNLKSIVLVIVQDFSMILSGLIMLTATRIMNAAKYGITLTEIVKIMMILSGRRDEVFKKPCEYHDMCKIIFELPGQSQALQRFCCVFARLEGDGFSTSSMLLLNAHVSLLIEEVIFDVYGPLLGVPSTPIVESTIFDLLQFSCNSIEPLSSTIQKDLFVEEKVGIVHRRYNPGQLRHMLIMTDFALYIKNKSVFLSNLNSVNMIHSRIVTGCVHWVVGNILQALRRVDLFDESEMKSVSILFRSLISHKSRVPLLEIQPDLYFSIMSTIPSKELLCRETMAVLGSKRVPWLRHSNKQPYFQSPIIDLADLPFSATSVATSKRGNLIAAGDFTGKLAAWRVSSSDLLCMFSSHSQAITGLAFSLLDYIIISCSSDCSININSVLSSSVLTTISPHSQPVSCLDVWSKESDTFVSVSRDGLAAIINLNLRSIAGRSAAWKAIKYKNQQSEFTDEELGSLLLEPSSVVFTFQVASFEVMARNVHTNFVDCVACHPSDKEIFATGSRDTTIFVWRVGFKNSGSRCIFQYLGHQHWVISLDWLQNGYTLLSSSKSSAIHVWRVPIEQDLGQAIQSNESVLGIPLEISSERIEEYSVPDKAQQISLKRDLSVRSSFLSVDTETHDEFSEFDGVRMFIEREEKEITQPSLTFNTSVTPSGSGASISVATNGIETAFKPAYTTCLLPSVSLDLKDARFPWKTKHAAKQYASNVRFLGSESMLVLSIENESLIYDTENCILTSLFQGHSDKINSLVFSPLLDIFVTASSDRFVKAWDISRAPKFDLLEHSSLSRITTIVIGRCNCDVFSDSMECTFFFGCSDGSLGVNKCHKTGILEPLISTDYSLSTFFLKHNYSVSSISFFRSAKSSFPDVVASGDENGGIILWNASDRKHLKTFATTRSSPIVACHFFLPAVAEGEEMHVNLFTITGDAFCVVWDAELGTAIRFINLPVPTVSHVQISKECSFCVLRHPGNSAFTLLDYISLANLGLLKPQLFVSENETMTSLTLSIGGERCAVGSSSGDICLLEPHSRHMISVGKHHQKDVTILLWTRFMNRLVSSSADMTLAIWDGSNSPCGEESEYSHGGFPVFEPIIFHKLDAKLTVIRECENLPWLLATMDDKCASCVWNIATATIVCKIAIHNSSPALAFFGKALCFGNAKENVPIVFSLEFTDALDMVRGKSSLLTDLSDQKTVAKEIKELQKWRAARAKHA